MLSLTADSLDTTSGSGIVVIIGRNGMVETAGPEQVFTGYIVFNQFAKILAIAPKAPSPPLRRLMAGRDRHVEHSALP
jgi:hypothetical protein